VVDKMELTKPDPVEEIAAERPDIEGLAPPHNVPMHTASAQAQHLTEGIEQLLEGAEQMLKRVAERPPAR
jgi:hypothetical protein